MKKKSHRRGRFGDRGVLTPILLLFLAAGALAVSLPSPARAAFGFEALSSSFTASGEVVDTFPAGSHPESWSLGIALTSVGPASERQPDGALKDLDIDVPPGVVAFPALLPQCSKDDFVENACPLSAVVGSISFVSTDKLKPAAVFLLEPAAGRAAQLGFHAEGYPATIDISVAPRPPFGIVVSMTNVTQALGLMGATMTLEGEPHGIPLLTLPRTCAQPLQMRFTAFSWQDPGAGVFGEAPEPQAVGDCQSLSYDPAVAIAPTTSDVASPSGIDMSLDAPDPGIADGGGRAAADTRSMTVTLPPGLTMNPPVADGLAVCTAAQLAAEMPDSSPGQGCPEAAKIGSATVTTPVFTEPIAGSICLGVPEGSDAPLATGGSASRLALYLILRDARRGVLVVLPLRVEADAQTGRLKVSLDEIPQIPITHLELHLNQGPRAPLSTSAACGPEAIGYSLTPSSGNPPVEGADQFSTGGPGCGARFAPSLSAGTTSAAAGHASPFVFKIEGGAAGPDLSGVEITMPPGLSASFAGVASCADGQAATGDCPAASKVGYVRIALGSGPEPLWVPAGEEPDSAVYLAGPYMGAPHSLVIVVPGQAGPFDLGTVVLRAPITVDPATAQASLSVEGLPQVLAGVPLRYRTVAVVLDRPGFIRNPTSCEPSAITGTAEAADGSTADISSRFQAADCAALSFKPKLSIRLSGGVGRGGHPGVRAVLRADPGGAAISSATVTLPPGELLDLRRLRGFCPRAVAVDRCPKSSLLGHLRLRTPLLDDPLGGSVYLRVPRHRLPEVSAEVRSGGLRFVVDGRVTARHGRFGIKLGSLPDIPLSEAVLSLPGGRKGIIVNSRSLCGSKKKVAATFTAHNGRRLRLGVRARVEGRC
jgi:hypothetical protein